MYSVVIPIFNEERILPALHERLLAALASLDEPFEVILVDDGSVDASFDLMMGIHAKDSRFKVLRLSRNFGHQIAISAGLDHAKGNAVILMDGDLQDPPELLPILVKHWKEGYGVVYTVKKSRKEGLLKRAAFKGFYRMLRRVSVIDIPTDAGNFSLLDRRVVDVIRSMPERNRYISGMRAWAGFKQKPVYYDRDARFAGSPQMSLARLFKLAFDGIFSFSDLPLRLAVFLGLMTGFLAFLAALVVFYEKLFTDKAIPGWASTNIAVLFVGGMILLTLGIIGEYISRIYEEVKHRPLYVVRDKAGL